MNRTLIPVALCVMALIVTALTGCYNRILSEPPQARRGVLAVAGASNARDLGGLPGYDGRAVRWGLLVRSGELDALTPGARDFLFGHGADRMGIGTVVDFRCAIPRLDFSADDDPEVASTATVSSERTRAPSRIPGGVLWSGDTGISETAVFYDIREIMWNRDLDFDEIVRHMSRGHGELVTLHRDQYLGFFEALLAADGPVLFHCSTGKSRTGVAAALLLIALGVPDEYIVDNYMQSLELVYERLFPVVPFIRGEMTRDMHRRRPDALAIAEYPPGEGVWLVEERLRQEAQRDVLRGMMQETFLTIISENPETPPNYAAEKAWEEIAEIAAALEADPNDPALQDLRDAIAAEFDVARGWMLELGRIDDDDFDDWVENFVWNAGNNIKPTLTVFPQWIESAIAAVRDSWDNGIEGFLDDHGRFGMSGAQVVSRLRELYLEPAPEN